MIDIENSSFQYSDNEEENPLLELNNTIVNKTHLKSIDKKRERSSSLECQNKVDYVISGNYILEQKSNKRIKISNNNFVSIKFNNSKNKGKLRINKVNMRYLLFTMIIFFIVALFSLYLRFKHIDNMKIYENQIITNSTTVYLPPNLRIKCEYWIKENVAELPPYCNFLNNKHY
jgi:hypothetical protein